MGKNAAYKGNVWWRQGDGSVAEWTCLNSYKRGQQKPVDIGRAAHSAQIFTKNTHRHGTIDVRAL